MGAFFPLHIFPQGALANSVITTVWLGVLVIAFFNLRFGWVLSGLVIPGYLVPLLLVKPAAVGVVLAEGIVTYFLVRFFFHMKPAVARIRLTSDSPVLVSAATRPEDLPPTRLVPEDSFRYGSEHVRQPLWFVIRPIGHLERRRQGASMVLVVQSRPPQDEADLLAGRYQWEDYHPEGSWLGRYILGPRDVGKPMRPEAALSTFEPLPSGREVACEVVSPTGEESVEPVLIYLKQDPEAASIELVVDGLSHFKGAVAGTRGEVPLPALAVGLHWVRLTVGAPGEFYLNCLEPGEGARLKRLANRFAQGELAFLYSRTSSDEETLAVHFFSPDPKLPRTLVRAAVERPRERPAGPAAGWTLDSYRFDVRLALDEPAPVMNTVSELVFPAQPFYLKFDVDSPPGEYRVRFELPPGQEGYLMLSRVKPGEVEQLSWRREERPSRRWEELLQEAVRGREYRHPAQEEVRAAESLFRRLLAGETGEELRSEWARFGFELLEVDTGGAPFAVVREAEHRKEGRGFYVFRAKPELAAALEAPHGFKDELTRELSVELMKTGPFAAAAWNTVPRWFERDGAVVHADLAHLPGTFFQAFTRAFGLEYPEGTIFQLHGFAREKRKTPAGKEADAILSNGTGEPSDRIDRLARSLRKVFPDSLRVYPIEVRELGGETNAQGQLLRSLAHGGFVHIELSREARLRLLEEAAVREVFRKALQEAARP